MTGCTWSTTAEYADTASPIKLLNSERVGESRQHRHQQPDACVRLHVLLQKEKNKSKHRQKLADASTLLVSTSDSARLRRAVVPASLSCLQTLLLSFAAALVVTGVLRGTR